MAHGLCQNDFIAFPAVSIYIQQNTFLRIRTVIFGIFGILIEFPCSRSRVFVHLYFPRQVGGCIIGEIAVFRPMQRIRQSAVYIYRIFHLFHRTVILVFLENIYESPVLPIRAVEIAQILTNRIIIGAVVDVVTFIIIYYRNAACRCNRNPLIRLKRFIICKGIYHPRVPSPVIA